jgi:hypothetical protein
LLLLREITDRTVLIVNRNRSSNIKTAMMLRSTADEPVRANRHNCKSTDSTVVKLAQLVFRVVVFACLAACSHVEEKTGEEFKVATLTGPNGGYYTKGWYTSTNAWGSSNLTYGKDYTINGTYDPTDITKGVSYSWNFGALPSNGDYNVLAYPEICYGQDPWDTSVDPNEKPFPLKISDITKFDASYNVSYGGQTAGYNVSFDMFVSNNPTGGSSAITDEVMVWVHTGDFNPGSPIASYTDGDGNAGKIYNFWAEGQGWEYSAFLTDKDTPAGTVDIAGILKKLQSMGIIQSSEYLEKIDIGAEVAAGSGTLTINNVGYDIQTVGSPEVIIGTPNATTPPPVTPPPVTPPPPPPPPPPVPPVTTAIQFLEPDFNHDGKADVLLQNTQTGYATLWTMNGLKQLSSVSVGNGGSTLKLVCAGDFNGDGSQDVLWQCTNGQPQVWLMNGTNLTSTQNVGTNPGSAWKIISVGDFNGDRKADILWQNSSTGQAMVWLMNGTSVASSATLGASPGANWKVMGTGDFDGDGKSDVLWQNSSTGATQIWLMNGTSVTSQQTVARNPGSTWHVVGTGDFNGDGKSDVLIQGTNGGIKIWEMNGATVLNGGDVGANPGYNWHAIGAEDVNGDGKDDILFQNTSGQVAVWVMNGLSVLSTGNVSNPGSAWHAVVGG